MLPIVLDAGHGGHDDGGFSLGRKEKDIVLAVSLYTYQQLAIRGYYCIPTRVDDTFVELSHRAQISNVANASIFVSIHANASGNPNAHGPWSLHCEGSVRGKDLASAIQRRLITIVPGSASAVYPDNSSWVGNRRLAVLRQTHAPACIVELGFMTNRGDLNIISDVRAQRSLAGAITNGIITFLGK